MKTRKSHYEFTLNQPPVMANVSVIFNVYLLTSNVKRAVSAASLEASLINTFNKTLTS